MTEGAPLPIPVDFAGDVVCLDCFMMLRRVKAVVATVPGLAVDIRWRPFQIDPDMPPEGQDRAAYVEAAHGSEEIAATLAGLAEIKRQFGIELTFDNIKRQPNTFAAHRLIRFASPFGREIEMAESLFQAFFLKGLDIGDQEVLAALAEQSGVDAVLAASFLKGDDGVAALKQELADVRAAGVLHPPRFTFAGKQTLVGVKPVEDIADALFGSIEDE
ncbi:MAG: DsbA family oxidoreductase [Methylocella sp.]